MTQPVTAILYAPGTNCHEETAAAVERAGGHPEHVLFHDLLNGEAVLKPYQALIIPGGFSYGDHLGAGRIFGALLVGRLSDQLEEFIESGKAILGICNGFQVLSEAGLLPDRSLGERHMALVQNQTSHFEDRKLRLLVSGEPCFWTDGLAGQTLEMPSAHGEGRPLFCPRETLKNARVIFRYADDAGRPTMRYPANPNDSPDAIAGIADGTGRVLGLMPHPERAALPAHYSQDGLKIFQNLVRWLKET